MGEVRQMEGGRGAERRACVREASLAAGRDMYLQGGGGGEEELGEADGRNRNSFGKRQKR